MFNRAVAVSLAIHLIVIFPVFQFFVVAQKIKPDHIVVDYIVAEEPKIPDFETKAEPAPVETPKIEMRRKVEVQPAPAARPAKSGAQKETPKELAQKQAPIRSTKEYIGYYQVIREKIRQRLKRNYRPGYGQGDVELIFILQSDGSLAAYDIDRARSTRDEPLISLATTSLKQASPFPPFPGALSLPKMAFTLTVSFKKE